VFKAEGRRQKAEVATRYRPSFVVTSAFCLLTSAFPACHREERPLTTKAFEAARSVPVRVGELQPGPKMQAAKQLDNPYEGNAYAVSRGQQLFEQYNCAGCHFHGGGGIGPALMDNEWIYGSSPANIYRSIAEGRPNGMPSWGGHIPDEQIWQLTTYVRALGGLEPKGAVSPRSDEMASKLAEQPRPPSKNKPQ
jgi:cytochrome c oxidase cbb3-type subunit 3